MTQSPENLWRVRFHVTRMLPEFPRPGTIASDRVTSTDYYFEGRLRAESTHCLFQYTLEGEGVFRDTRGEHRLPSGTGFLCEISDPKTGYFYPPWTSAPWVHLYFSFRGANAMVRELVDRFGGVYAVPLDSPLVGRFREHQRYSGSVLEVTPGEGASLVAGLLSTLADVGSEETHDTASAWIVREARRLVRTHLEENFNVADLAELLDVSHEHLCRVFKRELGVTPLRYLTHEKVRRASELLRDTTLSCKEVCLRLGYDNASHFARTFRRVTGTTPQQFRRHGAIPLL